MRARLDIEAAFHLGLGGFDDLDRQRQTEVMAWWCAHQPSPVLWRGDE